MILSYSIVSSIILACCFIAYRFFMAGERQHAMNRNMLRLIYALSLALPVAVLAVLMHHPQLSGATPNIEIGELKGAVAGGGAAPGIFNSSAVTSSPSNSTAPDKKSEIYTAVDKLAEFPDGMPALMNYLMNNIRYPEEAYKNNEQGRVIVKFVINNDGSVSDAQIVKGVSESLDKEALRVVSGMPKWIPGEVNGEPVDSYFVLPVSFKLQEDPVKEEQ